MYDAGIAVCILSCRCVYTLRSTVYTVHDKIQIKKNKIKFHVMPDNDHKIQLLKNKNRQSEMNGKYCRQESRHEINFKMWWECVAERDSSAQRNGMKKKSPLNNRFIQSIDVMDSCDTLPTFILRINNVCDWNGKHRPLWMYRINFSFSLHLHRNRCVRCTHKCEWNCEYRIWYLFIQRRKKCWEM